MRQRSSRQTDHFFFLLFFLAGTLAPFFRASDKPMAMACLRLFTLPPLPPLPERSVPRLRLRIALATVFLLFAPYFLPRDLRDPELLFFVAIMISAGHPFPIENLGFRKKSGLPAWSVLPAFL